jgi:hypothetical protein
VVGRAWLAFALLLVIEQSALAATFTVRTSADDCTTPPQDGLRWAITSANQAAGSDTIGFLAAMAGGQTISLQCPLPTVAGPLVWRGVTSVVIRPTQPNMGSMIIFDAGAGQTYDLSKLLLDGDTIPGSRGIELRSGNLMLFQSPH